MEEQKGGKQKGNRSTRGGEVASSTAGTAAAASNKSSKTTVSAAATAGSSNSSQRSRGTSSAARTLSAVIAAPTGPPKQRSSTRSPSSSRCTSTNTGAKPAGSETDKPHLRRPRLSAELRVHAGGPRVEASRRGLRSVSFAGGEVLSIAPRQPCTRVRLSARVTAACPGRLADLRSSEPFGAQGIWSAGKLVRFAW